MTNKNQSFALTRKGYKMAKSTTTYWNPLIPENDNRWEEMNNTNGLLQQLTLALDEETGDYTRLTRFKPGTDTTAFGSKRHEYPVRKGLCQYRARSENDK